MPLFSLPPSPAPAPAQLNPVGCEIRVTADKGRGVYATRALPAHTLIELSPVLLFSRDEYAAYGQYTLLDHYAFRWRDGRMALALGLGSLLNHSHTPNVSYTLERDAELIRYTTARVVEPGEELCIFYGAKLWFKPAGGAAIDSKDTSEDADDGWGGLSAVDDSLAVVKDGGPPDYSDARWTKLAFRYTDGDVDEVVLEDDLPLMRVRTTPDEIDEETADAVRTVEAAVVDIVNPKDTAAILKWLQQNQPDDPRLTHLRRIRRDPATGRTTVLLALGNDAAAGSSLAAAFGLAAPYSMPVPEFAAQTQGSLALKNAFWPTAYAPRRVGAPPVWTRGKLRWACEALRVLVGAAKAAKANGELPIAAHIPVPYELEDRAQLDRPFLAHDTRTSTRHPLRHAVLNVVRALADHRAASVPSPTPVDPATTEPVPALPTDTTSLAHGPAADVATPDANIAAARNGTNYLLTSLTLFVTHEPCIMCSMALTHSRVKEVVFLMPMPATGGCGGAACVPRLEGINHRFGIMGWKGADGWKEWWEGAGVEIDGTLDA